MRSPSAQDVKSLGHNGPGAWEINCSADHFPCVIYCALMMLFHPASHVHPSVPCPNYHHLAYVSRMLKENGFFFLFAITECLKWVVYVCNL